MEILLVDNIPGELSQPATGDVLRVLCVEDNDGDAKLNIWQLRAGGFAVNADIVESIEEFEVALSAKPYDVILADFALRGATGLDALAALQRAGKDIPFLFVTGSLGDDLAVECMKEGAADYILKDHPGRLTRAVRKALEKKAAREKIRFVDEERRKELAIAVEQIRTPVQTLIGMAERLGKSQLDAEQRQSVNAFRSAGASILAIVDGLLDSTQ
jgi:DNA-binding NtrC family response regulator